MVNSTCLVLFLSFLLAIVLSITFIEASNRGGFHIELVHRESPLSPFYNSSETNFDRSRRSAVRSMSRVKHLSLSATDFDTIVVKVIPNGQPDYLMKLSIGTPPVEFLAIVDTGSDLIWTQCNPCLNCYKQDLPLFDPKMSSTYRETSCTASPCQSLISSANAQCAINNTCEYIYAYGDLSQTSGTLATETFNFDSTDEKLRNISIPTLVFGCGHSNAGVFSSHGSGLVGLGGGPLSLVSQLGSKIDGKFSYCLVEMSENSTSKLKFGTQAILSGNNVVSTPLVSKAPITYYYLTLEAISVDGQRLESSKPAEGNIIIDSGSTLTTLPTELYNQFETALRKAIPDVPITDPSKQFDLCYGINSTLELPETIFNFMGGNVSLTKLNTFWQVSDELVCLTITPTKTDDDIPIFGNLAQINFLIEYDLVGRKVSFAATDCTKH